MLKREPNTDLAWSTLYSKLKNESLLNEESCKVKPQIKPLQVYWAAASIIVFLCASIIFLTYPDKEKDALLTLQNTDHENVLVKTLGDGSTVYLVSNASLSYPKAFTGGKREVLLHGEAMFDIAKNPEKPFLIETEKVTVRVLGTAFNIKTSKDGEFELTVKRGRVRVTEKEGGLSLEVVAGQSAVFTGNHLYKYLNRDKNIFEHYLAKMRFKDESLQNIVHVINQNSNSFVVLKGDQLKNSRLNVQFYNSNVNEMTQIISLALNLKREIRQDTIYMSQH